MTQALRAPYEVIREEPLMHKRLPHTRSRVLGDGDAPLQPSRRNS